MPGGLVCATRAMVWSCTRSWMQMRDLVTDIVDRYDLRLWAFAAHLLPSVPGFWSCTILTLHRGIKCGEVQSWCLRSCPMQTDIASQTYSSFPLLWSRYDLLVAKVVLAALG